MSDLLPFRIRDLEHSASDDTALRGKVLNQHVRALAQRHGTLGSCIHGHSVALLTKTGEVRRLWDIEQEVLRFALMYCEGSISEVSRQLGIGRSTLYRRIGDRRLFLADVSQGSDEQSRRR
jgi:transcriptional regulator of acetoin/glycerol metabolism